MKIQKNVRFKGGISTYGKSFTDQDVRVASKSSTAVKYGCQSTKAYSKVQ